MKNLLIIVGLVIAAVLVARRLMSRRGMDWEGIVERMPDTAPPKWMFRNIEAIRENTDHILERLPSSSDAGGAAPT